MSEDDQSPFGQFIRDRRKRAGLSQLQLADMIGLDRTDLNRIENGRIALPKADLRLALGQILQFTEKDLELLGIVRPETAWDAAFDIANSLARLVERVNSDQSVEGSIESPNVYRIVAAFLSLSPEQRLLMSDLVVGLMTAELPEEFLRTVLAIVRGQLRMDVETALWIRAYLERQTQLDPAHSNEDNTIANLASMISQTDWKDPSRASSLIGLMRMWRQDDMAGKGNQGQ